MCIEQRRAHAPADNHADADRDAHTYAYADRDAYTYTYAHADADPDRDTHADPHPGGHQEGHRVLPGVGYLCPQLSSG